MASGVDVGEMEEAPVEELPEVEVEAEAIPVADAEAAQPSA
jgi:hypothetical protein